MLCRALEVGCTCKKALRHHVLKAVCMSQMCSYQMENAGRLLQAHTWSYLCHQGYTYYFCLKPYEVPFQPQTSKQNNMKVEMANSIYCNWADISRKRWNGRPHDHMTLTRDWANRQSRHITFFFLGCSGSVCCWCSANQHSLSSKKKK